jgi:C1A family cysteine protease
LKIKLINFFILILILSSILATSTRVNENNFLIRDINKFQNSQLIPEDFSWIDLNGEDWTTSAKDQGNCGSCWNFAANGALESIINIRENNPKLDIDLSEQYVLSCLSRSGSCNGGYAYMAFKYMQRNDTWGNYCNGTIPEFCFPYLANDEISCDNKSMTWESYLIPILNYGKWSPDGSQEDIDLIKTQIMDTGPVIATMMATYYIHGDNNLDDWGWDHNNPNDYYAYPGDFSNTNHQVVIVGWKNDNNIGNGGYWIVKNSFSAEWGYNGFFNIEFGSLNIDNRDINWVDYDEESINNWMPNANAGDLYFGEVNREIIFNGSNSFDHEGEIRSYKWNLGDGSIEIGNIINHVFVEEGVYRIILEVEDENGNIANDTTWAFINRSNSQPENPKINGKVNGKNGTEYEYKISTIDPDGDNIYYYINWGDTFWEGRWDNWIGPYQSGEEIKVKNIFYEKGNYTIRVKAMDEYGYKSNWTILRTSMSHNVNIHSILEKIPICLNNLSTKINYVDFFLLLLKYKISSCLI